MIISHTPLGAIVKLTAASNIKQYVISLVRLYADSLNKEYLTNSVCYQLKRRVGLKGTLTKKNRELWNLLKWSKGEN